MTVIMPWLNDGCHASGQPYGGRDRGRDRDSIYGGTGLDTVDCGPNRDVVYINVRSDRGRTRNCEVIRLL
jgi:hypothetical protein